MDEHQQMFEQAQAAEAEVTRLKACLEPSPTETVYDEIAKPSIWKGGYEVAAAEREEFRAEVTRLKAELAEAEMRWTDTNGQLLQSRRANSEYHGLLLERIQKTESDLDKWRKRFGTDVPGEPYRMTREECDILDQALRRSAEVVKPVMHAATDAADFEKWLKANGKLYDKNSAEGRQEAYRDYQEATRPERERKAQRDQALGRAVQR